jgi:hypothetical protein
MAKDLRKNGERPGEECKYGKMGKNLGKNGIMEHWNSGEKMRYSNPKFHHSNIP